MNTKRSQLSNSIDQETIQKFRNSIRGKLIQPDDSEYDEARSIYNGMIDKHPRFIVQCTNVADVIASVNFARENSLETAIRGGGHSGPGLGLVDGGVVIDLSPMKGIRVDPSAKTVRVEPGCTWGEVDHATHAFGLATVSGVISTTGVGGLTLGGGHGYLTRKYGLTIDNLISADVVLADGSLVHTSKDHKPELFWAIRGGGGSFGVVTSFEFQLHPVKNVYAGPMFWKVNDLETTLKWYRNWLKKQPDDIYAFYLVAEVPPGDPFPKAIHGEKVCGLLWCCTGDEKLFNQALDEARNVISPLFEFTGNMPYPALQSMFDELYPAGMQWYWKGDFVNEISDKAIEIHKKYGSVPTMHSTMHLYPVNGAAHRPNNKDTAWDKRDATWSMVIAGVDPEPSNAETITNWAKDYWKALHPHTMGGAYINFMMEEGEDRIKATYGKNYNRLKKIKSKYDPNNFFHINQNIEPS